MDSLVIFILSYRDEDPPVDPRIFFSRQDAISQMEREFNNSLAHLYEYEYEEEATVCTGEYATIACDVGWMEWKITEHSISLKNDIPSLVVPMDTKQSDRSEEHAEN